MQNIGQKSGSVSKGRVKTDFSTHTCLFQTKNRMHMSTTQIDSIMMHIQHQLATMRMAGAIQQSTDVMKSMQQLIKVPEIMNTMREMVSSFFTEKLQPRFKN